MFACADILSPYLGFFIIFELAFDAFLVSFWRFGHAKRFINLHEEIQLRNSFSLDKNTAFWQYDISRGKIFKDDKMTRR